MPIVDNPGAKGNLILQFSIEFPCYLPKNSKVLLQKAFQVAKIGGGCNEHEWINKIVLADKMRRIDPNEQFPPM